MDSLKLGMTGAGNMAAAIMNNVIEKGLFLPQEIYAYDPDEAKLGRFTDLGVCGCASNAQVVSKADIIILAVKPQMIAGVLEEIRGEIKGKCLVSIAAGISSSYIKSIVGRDAFVLRTMPNTPMMIGCGAIAIAHDSTIPQKLFDAAVSIFSSAGEVAFLPEEKLNEIIGVNGSSPAFFFRLAQAMMLSAEKQGIDPDVALKLAAKTMEGASAMLLGSGYTPCELIRQVSSPGGTTIAALSAFDEFKFDELIEEAMLRCTKRAYELGK